MSSAVSAHALLWTRPAVTDLFYLRPGIRGRHWGEDPVETNIVSVHFVEDVVVVVAKAQRPEQLVVLWYGNDRLSPHIYQTVDDAYRQMLRGLETQKMLEVENKKRKCSSMRTKNKDLEEMKSSIGKNQSILMSGESGAGNTVTAKRNGPNVARRSRLRGGCDGLSTRAR